MNKLLVAVIFLSFSMNGFTDPRKDKSHPCAKDFPLHCQDQAPSDENYWDCLGKKMSMLSEQCSTFMKEEVYLKLNDCGKDILNFCHGTKMNYGNWVPCLQERKSELSNKCSRMISKMERKWKIRAEFTTTCKSDIGKLCKKSDDRQCLPVIREMDPSVLTPECAKTISEIKALF